jgi:hypothetical protein
MGDEEVANVQSSAKRLTFNALTPAKVIDITFVENDRRPAPKSESTQIRVSIRVKMKLLTPIEGQDEFFTNYGVSIYEKTTGEKSLSWGGVTDAMALCDLVADASGIPKEQIDLLKLKNYLLGKTVYCKSENRNNPTDGSTVSKALIKQIKME